MIRSAVATANSNIALIKYWGKRGAKPNLNLPMNSSLSLTLDNQLSTTTSVEFSREHKKDIVIINGKIASEKSRKRVISHLDIIRGIAKCNLKARVVSENTFPSSSGLASSASGFAALTAATASALQLDLSSAKLSEIARRGSGSACRSIIGGIVEWEKGVRPDGSDSTARQLHDEGYWKELRDVIAIVSDAEKKVSSREGMQATVRTSRLYKERMKNVQERLLLMKAALAAKDTETLFSLIMHDSDEMHATMLDTTPRLDYLLPASHEIKKMINDYNKEKIRAAYTFDAGPNAHIITTDSQVNDIKKSLQKISGIKKLIVAKVGNGAASHNTSYTIVKAPGKVLLFGGYALLEGGRGLVVTVDAGTTTKTTITQGNKINISVPNYKINTTGNFVSNKININKKLSEKERKKLRFALAAIEEAAKVIKKNKKEFCGVSIESVNDDALGKGEMKTGLGSSASAVVSIVASLLDLYGVDIESDRGRKFVFETSLAAHHKAQGRLGSGFDIAAACFGTHFFQRKEAKTIIKKAKWPENLVAGLAFSNKSADTRDLVKRVIDYKKNNKREYNEIMKRYVFACNKIRDVNQAIKNIEKLSTLRKELGEKAGVDIESDKQSMILAELKKRGAVFAVLPGAGGGDSLLYAARNPASLNAIERFLKKNNYVILGVSIDDRGYRLIQ